MFACTKFGRNRSGDIDFRAQKPPQMFGVKEVAFKKYHKKYFTRLYMSRYHFIPTNPLLAALRIFSFFQNIVRPSPKRRTTETNKTKLYHMRYCDVQTMQTKFARFCQKKQWTWNWTPQWFEEIDAPDQVTAKMTMHLYPPITDSHVNLLLVQSHQAEIIIVKRLIQGRNNVTRVRVELMIMRSESS